MLNQRQAPVDDARSWRLRCDSERVSEDEVADAGSERCDVGVDGEGRCGAGELRRTGHCASASRVDGAIGLQAADRRVGRVAGGDGRGEVRDAGRSGAGLGDGVDAVDG